MSYRSVRATRLERTRDLPGDQLIPDPSGSLTHAITIACPRHEVWPWLAQMGAGTRAGWYSYDVIDNDGLPSADRIMPKLQGLSVGTLFPALPGKTDNFRVMQFERERFLVLGSVPGPEAPPVVTWTFMLEPIDAEHTRLITRARAGRDYSFYGLPPLVGRPLIRVGHFVMERKQLLGIAWRAERAPVGSRRKEAA